jgi:hypothetical protein
MNRVKIYVITKGIAGILIGTSILFSAGCECSQANQSHERTLLQKPEDETTGEHLNNYFGENLPEGLCSDAFFALMGL